MRDVLFCAILSDVKKVCLFKYLIPENKNHRRGAAVIFLQYLGADFFYLEAAGTGNDHPDRSAAVLNRVVYR